MRKLFWISGQKYGSLIDHFTTSGFLFLGEDRLISSFLICFGSDQPFYRLCFYLQKVTGLTDEKRNDINIDSSMKELGSGC